MKKYIGGYSIIDLASTTIYADALGALKQDKPVLVYDTPECYYADTISLDGTSVVITKGGKIITIANDNTITNVGDIQNHLYVYTIDVDGEIDNNNNRFFGKIVCAENIEGINNTFTEPSKADMTKLLDLINNYGCIVGGLVNFGTQCSAGNLYEASWDDEEAETISLTIYDESGSDTTKGEITKSTIFAQKLQLF